MNLDTLGTLIRSQRTELTKTIQQRSIVNNRDSEYSRMTQISEERVSDRVSLATPVVPTVKCIQSIYGLWQSENRNSCGVYI